MHTALNVAMWTAGLSEAVLLARLLRLGFYRVTRYPVFTAFIVADLLQFCATTAVPVSIRSRTYFSMWVATETVLFILQLLAAREACLRIRTAYPGIGKFGQNVIEWAFLMAVFLAVGSTFYDLRRMDWLLPAALPVALLLKRILMATLAGFLALTAVFSSLAPAPIVPNLRRHIRILAGYFAIMAATHELAAVRQLKPTVASIVLMGGATICFLLWIFAFRPGDESLPAPPPITPKEAEAAHRDMGELDQHIRQLKPG